MTHKIRVFPHNDLLNLAYYQRENINDKVAADCEDGLALDCQACIISLAFSVEALINFVGHKKVENWNEFQRYPAKLRQVCAVAQVEHDLETEPLSMIKLLQGLRNSMAHGKPIETDVEVNSREELRSAMSCVWVDYLTPEFVNAAYAAVKQFKVLLFNGCRITVGESLTSARR